MKIYMSFTALEKNLLRISTTFTSLTISLSMLPPVSRVFLCSINVIFSNDLLLSESKGFPVHQNCLLSVSSFPLQIRVQLVFVKEIRNSLSIYSGLTLSEWFLRYIFLKRLLLIKVFLWFYLQKALYVSSGIRFLLWCKFIQSLNTHLQKLSQAIIINSFLL